MKLTEAFRALNALNEDTFSVSDDGIAKLAEFEQNDDLADDISVIDPEAETEGDLEDSYVGKVILDCTTCHSKLFKDLEEIELNDDQTLANVEEECPYCYTVGGFKVMGEVSAFGGKTGESEDSTDTDDDAKPADTDNKDDDVVEESLQEAVATLDRPMSGIGGTLSNVMAAHSDELANVYDTASAISFLDSIEPEVKNKGYLQNIKAKLAKMPGTRAAQFLYNIILKGDGMGTKMESVDDTPLNESKSIKESESVTSEFNNLITPIKDKYPEVDFIINAYKKLGCEVVADSNKERDIVEAEIIKITDGTKFKYIESADRMNKAKWNRAYVNIVFDFDDSSLDESKSIKESVNNVNVETDDSIVNVNTDDSGKVTVTTEPKTAEETPVDGAEVITPLTDEHEDELLNGAVEDEFSDVELDEFDDETFDGLGEGYLKKVYENVQSYKTTDCSMKDDKIILEGVITFNSGAKKKTSFIFEAKDFTKSGKYRFIGENTQLTRGKKAFTLKGRIDEGKFITESFNYNYKAKDTAGNSTRIYGTIKG